jgi:hypothetical protein
VLEIDFRLDSRDGPCYFSVVLQQVRVPKVGSLYFEQDSKMSAWSNNVLNAPDRVSFPGIEHSLPDLLRFARIVAKDLGLKRKQLALFQVAAKHDWWPGAANPPEGGEIASFIAAHENVVKIRYRAFQHGLKRDRFSIVPPTDEGKKVRDGSIDSYQKLYVEVLTQLNDRNRLPIIFSFDAFSGSRLDVKRPFWLLPGLHFHRGTVSDLLGNSASIVAGSNAEEAIRALMVSRYQLRQSPVVEVLDGRYRMWWCNTELGGAPLPKSAKHQLALKHRRRPDFDNLPAERGSFPRPEPPRYM